MCWTKTLPESSPRNRSCPIALHVPWSRTSLLMALYLETMLPVLRLHETRTLQISQKKRKWKQVWATIMAALGTNLYAGISIRNAFLPISKTWKNVFLVAYVSNCFRCHQRRFRKELPQIHSLLRAQNVSKMQRRVSSYSIFSNTSKIPPRIPRPRRLKRQRTSQLC